MFDKWHNKRFDKNLADVPSWRLRQELTGRGVLRVARPPVMFKHHPDGAYDQYGCPLLQQFGDDGLPLYAPRD